MITSSTLSLMLTTPKRRLGRAVVAFAALVLVSACTAPASKQVDERAHAPRVETVAAPIDHAPLRAQLAAHRAQQIAHLHAYGVAGQFPHNTTTAPSLHMFRDPAGRLCAVANLVQTDGRGDLVEATVRDANALAIADVHRGQMMDWIVESGLTQEELVAIQLPAPIMMKPAPKPRPPTSVARKTEAQMNAAVTSHVVEMEARLQADTAKSLDLAVERYVAAHTAS